MGMRALAPFQCRNYSCDQTTFVYSVVSAIVLFVSSGLGCGGEDLKLGFDEDVAKNKKSVPRDVVYLRDGKSATHPCRYYNLHTSLPVST
jgi:hypothetical protein